MHQREGARKKRRSDLVKEGGDNLAQVAVVFFFSFFLGGGFVLRQKICLASYLSGNVGSLICLLLLSVLLLKPAVSVDCLWSLRQEAG